MKLVHRKVLEIPTAFESSKRYKKKVFKKRLYIFFMILLTLISFIIFPAFINWVVTYGGERFDFLIPETGISRSNQWVGFLASYSGSIIGGFISGFLTLGGVLWTLKKGDKKDEITNYPPTRKAIIDLERQLEIANKRVESYLYHSWDPKWTLLSPLTETVTILSDECEILSKIAANINGYTLLSILDFKDEIEALKAMIESKKILLLNKKELEEVFLGVKFSWEAIQNSINIENRKYLDKMAEVILHNK